MSLGVLYVVMCAAGATRLVPSKLLPMASDRGWDVHAVATERAAEVFPEAMEQIEVSTGRPVRTAFHTTVGYSLPDPDAVLVAPASYNTLTKLALGIADTYVLTRLTEQVGRGVPIAVGPYINEKFATHPTYEATLKRLLSWGVRVVIGPDEPHRSGGGTALTFPWTGLLDALEPPGREHGPAEQSGRSSLRLPRPTGPGRACPDPRSEHSCTALPSTHREPWTFVADDVGDE